MKNDKCITESLCCTPETNTTLRINHSSTLKPWLKQIKGMKVPAIKQNIHSDLSHCCFLSDSSLIKCNPDSPHQQTPYLTFPPYRPVFQWSWEACPKSVPLGLLLLFPLLAGITPTLQVLVATSSPGGLSWFLTWEISRPPNSSWPLPVWILSVGVPGTSHWIRQTQLLDSPKPAPSKVSSIPVNRITPFDGFVSNPHPWLPLPHIPSSKPSASLGILPPKSVLNLALVCQLTPWISTMASAHPGDPYSLLPSGSQSAIFLLNHLRTQL